MAIGKRMSVALCDVIESGTILSERDVRGWDHHEATVLAARGLCLVRLATWRQDSHERHYHYVVCPLLSDRR